MKKFLALIILGSLVIAGCSSEKKEKVSDQVAATAEQAQDQAQQAQDAAAAAVNDASTTDIMKTLASTGQNATLVAAIQAAGLADQLSQGGPFTIFAPTDAAFQKLDKSTLANLLLPANKDQLSKILTLHVVNGKVTSADLKTQDVVTLNGQSVPVIVDDINKSVTFGPANVTTPDIQAANGVIHEIDSIVLPQQ